MTFLWLILRCLCPDMSKSVSFLSFVLQDSSPFREAVSPMAPITCLFPHQTSDYHWLTGLTAQQLLLWSKTSSSLTSQIIFSYYHVSQGFSNCLAQLAGKLRTGGVWWVLLYISVELYFIHYRCLAAAANIFNVSCFTKACWSHQNIYIFLKINRQNQLKLLENFLRKLFNSGHDVNVSHIFLGVKGA